MQKRDLTRQEYIHGLGFNMLRDTRRDVAIDQTVVDYSKVKLGNGPVKPTSDATINLKTALKSTGSEYTDKEKILNYIHRNDIDELRQASEFYYQTSGIYKRAVIYMASLFRNDYFVYPILTKNKKLKNNSAYLNDYYKVLNYFEESEIKKLCNKFSLEIIKNGCYYGYKLDDIQDKIVIQDLPPKYCRSKYYINNLRRNFL